MAQRGHCFDLLTGQGCPRNVAGSPSQGPRDYALFRALYQAGLRSEEAALLERCDVHFDRGPFGKLHVRFGKGARLPDLQSGAGFGLLSASPTARLLSTCLTTPQLSRQ